MQGPGHGHSHHDGICTLHDLNIAHQMGMVSRCQPQDGSGSIGQTGRSVLGVDLCRPQACFWGQGEWDPINALLRIVSAMKKEPGKTTSTNAIAADLVIAMDKSIHERVVEKEQQDSLHELAPKERKDHPRCSCLKCLHVKVLNIVWKLV